MIIWLFSTKHCCLHFREVVDKMVREEPSFLTRYKTFFFSFFFLSITFRGQDNDTALALGDATLSGVRKKCSHENPLGLIFNKAWCEGTWTYAGAIRRRLGHKTAWWCCFCAREDASLVFKLSHAAQRLAATRAGGIHPLSCIWEARALINFLNKILCVSASCFWLAALPLWWPFPRDETFCSKRRNQTHNKPLKALQRVGAGGGGGECTSWPAGCLCNLR